MTERRFWYEEVFTGISSGNAFKNTFPQEVEKILSSKNITTPVSVFVRIRRPNPCLSFKIDFGIEYCLKESWKSKLLAWKIGSEGTIKGTLWMIRYFKSSPFISTPSQKESVPMRILLSEFLKKTLFAFVYFIKLIGLINVYFSLLDNGWVKYNNLVS